MAKRFIDPVIIVPWFDTEGMKQRSHLVFKGEVDARRVKREVTRFMRDNFNCRPHTGYVQKLVQANIAAFTQVMNPAFKIADRKAGLNQQIEDWLQRIQDDSNDDQGCTESESEVTGVPELDMSSMQVESTGDGVQESVLRP